MHRRRHRQTRRRDMGIWRPCTSEVVIPSGQDWLIPLPIPTPPTSMSIPISTSLLPCPVPQVNCELIAVSVDSQFSHLAWVNTPRSKGGLGHMEIPLVADLNKQISEDYGVLIDGAGIALRGLFIIDGEGNIRMMQINDLPVGRSVEETLRLVNAFQFTDKHGEVCPADWTPGSASMKADPKGSQEYFSSQHKD